MRTASPGGGLSPGTGASAVGWNRAWTLAVRAGECSKGGIASDAVVPIGTLSRARPPMPTPMPMPTPLPPGSAGAAAHGHLAPGARDVQGDQIGGKQHGGIRGGERTSAVPAAAGQLPGVQACPVCACQRWRGDACWSLPCCCAPAPQTCPPAHAVPAGRSGCWGGRWSAGRSGAGGAGRLPAGRRTQQRSPCCSGCGRDRPSLAAGCAA